MKVRARQRKDAKLVAGLTRTMKTLSLIYATSENHVIGKDNRIPWHVPADLKRYKHLTLGHPIIMGRRTFEGIGQPLPGRQNIVLTSDLSYHHEGIDVVHSLQEAIDKAEDDDIFVIGGAGLFAEALPRAARIYETRIKAVVEGDTFFDPDLSHWLEESTEAHKADADNQYDYEFVNYVRS
jgi:dihydrofolate reductase